MDSKSELLFWDLGILKIIFFIVLVPVLLIVLLTHILLSSILASLTIPMSLWTQKPKNIPIVLKVSKVLKRSRYLSKVLFFFFFYIVDFNLYGNDSKTRTPPEFIGRGSQMHSGIFS